jgi:hypothetical protein
MKNSKKSAHVLMLERIQKHYGKDWKKECVKRGIHVGANVPPLGYKSRMQERAEKANPKLNFKQEKKATIWG